VIYITHTRLMSESERTVHYYADFGELQDQRVCRQLLGNKPRYNLWISRHDRKMDTVAKVKARERQLLRLRGVALEQIHRAALVRYLRDYRVTGGNRDLTLREFYGTLDSQRSAVAEHKHYLLSASSQLCATDLLELAGDLRGIDMIRYYETAYGQYFSMFCDRARARQRQEPYLLGTLLPDIKATSDRLRLRILRGDLMPRKTVRAYPTRRSA
jgi:hypothetical protein